MKILIIWCDCGLRSYACPNSHVHPRDVAGEWLVWRSEPQWPYSKPLAFIYFAPSTYIRDEAHLHRHPIILNKWTPTHSLAIR